MVTDARLDDFAQQLATARAEVSTLVPFTTQDPAFDLAAAYTLADRVHRQRIAHGEVAMGRKIGFTNAQMWAPYGVHQPIWGYLYDSTVASATVEPCTCSLGSFAEPKIEPEIVLHLHAAPSAGGDLDAMLAAVDWIALGFEVVQSHFPLWQFQAPDTVADGALHGCLLVGEPQPVAALGGDVARALESFELQLFKDDTLVEAGRGANVLGSPLRALAHLVGVLKQQPFAPPLRAGELVTTGTVTTAHTVAPGETWVARVAGSTLPEVTVRFEA